MKSAVNTAYLVLLAIVTLFGAICAMVGILLYLGLLVRQPSDRQSGVLWAYPIGSLACGGALLAHDLVARGQRYTATTASGFSIFYRSAGKLLATRVNCHVGLGSLVSLVLRAPSVKDLANDLSAGMWALLWISWGVQGALLLYVAVGTRQKAYL
ncbi:hypothetical protein DFJ77DRAFT_440029 [Powellomyces hirtus]|nr:hypothetical protein DFJ77DRAFT_440029 [Powellomyces hirtus]